MNQNIQTVDEGLRKHDLGVYYSVPPEDYFRSPGISKHGLDNIRRSPMHYQFLRNHPKEPSPSMKIGTAVHTLILEPDEFCLRYTKLPENAPNRPSSRQVCAKKPSPETLQAIEFWSNWDAQNAGKIALQSDPSAGIWDKDEWRQVHAMSESVRSHPTVMQLLDGLKREVSGWWMNGEFGRLCKGRPDGVNEKLRILVDIKTASDASYQAFIRSVAEYRYQVQDAWYSDGWAALHDGEVWDFVFVVVESIPPYACAVYELTLDDKRIGREMYRQDLRVYDECKRTGEWPGYPAEIRELRLSEWSRRGRIY